jgi:hypothetical protein
LFFGSDDKKDLNRFYFARLFNKLHSFEKRRERCSIMLIPKKIKSGDHIRVISSSKSFSILSKETVDIALQRLRVLGLTVSIPQHASEGSSLSLSHLYYKR